MMTSFSVSKERARSSSGEYRWIPWLFVAAFALVFAVNGGLVYYALSSWPGLTTDHAYNEGLAYNRVIEETEKERKLGWSLAIDFIPDRPGAESGQLLVEAKGKDGAPLDGLAMRAEFVRPVEEMREIPVALETGRSGRYVASVTLPRHGQWDVYVVARQGDEIYHTGRRLLVP